MKWVMPRTVEDLFLQWRLGIKGVGQNFVEVRFICLLFGRFGWKEIEECLEISSNPLRRLFNPLFGMCHSGHVTKRSLKESL